MESCNFCSSKHHRTNWLCLLFCCPFSKMQEHSCLNLRKKQKTFFNYSKWQKEFRKHEQLEIILNLRAHSSVTSFVFGFVAETDFVGPNVHSWLSLFIWLVVFFPCDTLVPNTKQATICSFMMNVRRSCHQNCHQKQQNFTKSLCNVRIEAKMTYRDISSSFLIQKDKHSKKFICMNTGFSLFFNCLF